MYTNDRNAYRQTFFLTWEKYLKRLPLEPVEQQLLEVILQHPEYHAVLENRKQFEQQEFEPEENPFFHMSLHLAIRDQIKMNRPIGITPIYTQLASQYDALEAEHKMMTCLANALWQAQRDNTMPNEQTYLASLNNLT